MRSSDVTRSRFFFPVFDNGTLQIAKILLTAMQRASRSSSANISKIIFSGWAEYAFRWRTLILIYLGNWRIFG